MNDRVVGRFCVSDPNGDRFVVVVTGKNVRRYSGKLAAPFVHFRAIDGNVARSINSDAHPIALNRDNRNADISADDDFFARAS